MTMVNTVIFVYPRQYKKNNKWLNINRLISNDIL